FAAIVVVALITVVAASAARPALVEAIVMSSVVVLLLMGLAAVLAARRSKRGLQSHRVPICPPCLAPPEIPPGESRCAACGFVFESPAALERLWRESYRMG